MKLFASKEDINTKINYFINWRLFYQSKGLYQWY